MPSEHELLQQIESKIALLSQAVAGVRFWHDRLVQVAQQAYEQQIASSKELYQQSLTQAQSTYVETLVQTATHVQQMTHALGSVAATWDAQFWESWNPFSTKDTLSPTRVGSLIQQGRWDSFVQPMFVPLVGYGNLVFMSSIQDKSSVVSMIQSLLTRLLASIPPGKLRFTFIDPVGLAQNVAGFMRLADHDEKLITSRAWTSPQHIEQRLVDLTEHIENVIQKYLRNQYADIVEYNADAGEVAEPYYVLVVFDFPTNFTEVAARQLVSIVQNGPRCGIYTILVVDTDKDLPGGLLMDELEQNATIITGDSKRRFWKWVDGVWSWQDEEFKDCLLELDEPPPTELFNRIITTVGEVAKSADKVEVPFARIAPPPSEQWTGDTGSELRVALGPSGARKLQMLELGRGTAQHVLVAGKTGSGKSTLLHTLITNLALHYSPDQLQLYLIDFKKGVEFKTYVTHALPHARVIAIESEREFGLSVLQGLDAELKRRGDLFRAAGVDDLPTYRQKLSTPSPSPCTERGPGGEVLPRILLLVDEFQEFFTDDDTVATQSAQLLDRLVRQGRAFGIHVLLGSQTLAGAYTLARSTIDQMAVRIALQCSEADSRLILSDDNPAARLLARPGEAIYNAANGRVEGNNPFQVAYLTDEERDHYLERVHALAQQHNYRPQQPQLVFEGNAPGAIEKNRPLADLLASPLSTSFVESRRKGVRAWLGDPIAIREPVTALFRKQSGSNLLIVGQSEEAALGMLAASLLSFAAQLPVEGAIFYVLDFGAADDVHADYFTHLQEYLPHDLKLGRRRQLPDFLNTLAAEVQQRLDSEGSVQRPIFLFIHGLQRARDLRADESAGFGYNFSNEPQPLTLPQQFATILRDGPDVSIHTLAWCDTMANLERTLDRRSLREFSLRVAMQMSEQDSSLLLDTPAANRLGLHRAFFYSEDEGRLEKFRPYGLPTPEWLQAVGEQLHK